MKYTVGNVVFDGWKIEREIGEGAYGKVFEIKKTEYNITATSALKVITIPKSQNEIKSAYGEGLDEQSVTSYFKGFVDEIVKEISFMTKVKSHPNIVRFEDYKVVEHKDGIGWDVLIRMEYLTPFVDYIISNKLSESDVVRLGIEIAGALDFCHKKGMVHRDVKPENIFVDENGTFKIGDFGVARTIDKTTGGMSKKGTEVYMAPEVYLGKEYNSSVDTYSLGLVLYRILNGNRLPFLPLAPSPITYEDRENALVKRIKGDALVAPTMASSQVAEVVLKACEYLPENRYETAGKLKDALKKIEASLTEKSQQKNLNPSLDGDNEHTVGLWDCVKPRENINYMQPDTEVAKSDDLVEQSQTEDAIEEGAEIKAAETEMPAKNNCSKKKIIIPIVIGGAILLAGALFAIIVFLIPNLSSNKIVGGDVSVENVEEQNAEDSSIENNEKEFQYKTAVELEKQEKYGEAAAVYEMVYGYKDSNEKYYYCHKMSRYIEAKSLYDKKEYLEAKVIFLSLGDFLDSADWVNRTNYKIADEAYTNGEYFGAKNLFYGLRDFEDSNKRYKASVYAYAKECIKSKKYIVAVLELQKIKGYKDSDSLERKAKLKYIKDHKNLFDSNTVDYLDDLVAYGDSEAKAIYDELYDIGQWKIDLIAVNGDKDDYETINDSVKRKYVHFWFVIAGGPDNKEINLTHRTRFTYKSRGQKYVDYYSDWIWENIKKGDKFFIEWPDGVSEDCDEMEIQIFKNDTGAPMGKWSVKIESD